MFQDYDAVYVVTDTKKFIQDEVRMGMRNGSKGEDFMQITTENFEQFIIGSWDYDKERGCHTGIWLRSDNMDITGGRITKEEIDRLSMYENREVLTISGLTQETFEYFIKKYGSELRAIRFFKNKMVEDWSLLETLPDIEYIYWFHNQRITKLWDMRKNVALKGLCISDFTRLKRLDGIEKAPKLCWFSFRDAIWDKNVVESYKCFENSNIRYLHFGAKKILDGDISFVAKMPNLEYFDFNPNLFETEKIAWVMANCPEIKGYAFHIFIDEYMYNKESLEFDIPALRIPGKGKRCFVATDIDKKNKLQKEFVQMMDKYRGKDYYENSCG